MLRVRTCTASEIVLYIVSLDRDCLQHLFRYRSTHEAEELCTERQLLYRVCILCLSCRSSCITALSYVAGIDFPIPDLEIVGCPVTYNDNKYEVNFQWRAPFSRALLSFIRHFTITVFEKEGGRDIPLETFDSEFELVNVGDGSGRTGSCSVIQYTYLSPRWTITLFTAINKLYPHLGIKRGSTELE